jgi:hypothetical protein
MEENYENLIYIKGFLDSISYINTFDNDGKTYFVELIEKVNCDFQETLRKRFNVKHWEIKTEFKYNWRSTLKSDLRPYFDQIIKEVYLKTNVETLFDEKGSPKHNYQELIDNVRLDNKFYIDHLLIDKFLDKIETIVGKEPQLYKVEVNWHISDEGWYELYCNDFLFDLGNKILFLHFGGSD